MPHFQEVNCQPTHPALVVLNALQAVQLKLRQWARSQERLLRHDYAFRATERRGVIAAVPEGALPLLMMNEKCAFGAVSNQRTVVYVYMLAALLVLLPPFKPNRNEFSDGPRKTRLTSLEWF